MNWWGKLIGSGFGLILGGPLGALIGLAVGHQFDKGLKHIELEPGDTERVQLAFFTATFSVMGYLAKVDGQVSQSEIQMAERIMAQMNLDADKRRAAIDLFKLGKQADFSLDEVLTQFRHECHRRTSLLQMFLEILISTACADQNLHPAEINALKHIALNLGFSEAQVEQLINIQGAQYRQSHRSAHQPQAQSLDDAYAILGLDRQATDTDIKRAYRRQISQHHPDKLVAKGLPEEMIKLANQKTGEIKNAYEQIKQSRKV